MNSKQKPRSILVADSDRSTRRDIRSFASMAKLHIDEASNGQTARTMLQKNTYDMAVLNVNLPLLSGVELLGDRTISCPPPMLMLSNGYDEAECLRCFELGAKDYVVKPYYPQELLMRFHVIMGSSLHPADRPEAGRPLILGPVTVDREKRTVYVDGEKRDLPPKAYELLLYLMEHKGETISRKQLMRDIWDKRSSALDRTLDTHMRMLRTALSPHGDLIMTMRRVGYRFDPPEETEEC